MKPSAPAVILFTLALLGAGAAHAQLIDNNDGTITDTVQNLVWLKNANCFGTQGWYNAKYSASGLSPSQCGLSNTPAGKGSWRLPTKEELTSRVGNRSGFTNVQPHFYWSSSNAPGTNYAWYVYVQDGIAYYGNMGSAVYVWPVRAAQ